MPSRTLNQSVELNPHDDQMLSTNYNHVLMVGVMSLIRYGFFLNSRLLTRDIVELPLEFQATGQTIPFWTGFNCLLSEKRPDVYSPIIDAKPNDMATVYTAMKKCLDMTNEAGQEHAMQTFDQQLYAQQVKWSKPDIFNCHVLRLGGFHSLSCFLSSIGKLWADGGLRDLLVDSDMYVGNTAVGWQRI